MGPTPIVDVVSTLAGSVQGVVCALIYLAILLNKATYSGNSHGSAANGAAVVFFP